MSEIIESDVTLNFITKKEEPTTRGWGDLTEHTQQFFFNLFTLNGITTKLLPPNR